MFAYTNKNISKYGHVISIKNSSMSEKTLQQENMFTYNVLHRKCRALNTVSTEKVGRLVGQIV
jgi:hypothetical protein